jgi:hypothetical protein
MEAAPGLLFQGFFMQTIMLTRGLVATVDDEDFDRLEGFLWFAVPVRKSCCYAHRTVTIDGIRRQISMHRDILGLDFGDRSYVDHKDGDGLNNRRSNLRVCDHAQSAWNRINPVGACGFTGVTDTKYGNRFVARICVRGRRLTLGRFRTVDEARQAYEMAARRFFGEFAPINRG